MTSLFRAAFDPWAGDPAFEDLVGRLSSASPSFSRWCTEHDVAAPLSGSKLLHHGEHMVRYDYASFQADDDVGLKLAIYVRTSET